jgi:hypothetical protein
MNTDERRCPDSLTERVIAAIVEVSNTTRARKTPLVNYLRASGRSVCLLVNFQRPKAEWRRIVNGYQPAETAENAPNLPADLPGTVSNRKGISFI